MRAAVSLLLYLVAVVAIVFGVAGYDWRLALIAGGAAAAALAWKLDGQ
jgi:hypothetical protein